MKPFECHWDIISQDRDRLFGRACKARAGPAPPDGYAGYHQRLSPHFGCPSAHMGHSRYSSLSGFIRCSVQSARLRKRVAKGSGGRPGPGVQSSSTTATRPEPSNSSNSASSLPARRPINLTGTPCVHRMAGCYLNGKLPLKSCDLVGLVGG